MVTHFGSSPINERDLLQIIESNFDLRPGAIIKQLGLTRPIYQRTAENGHFGNAEFPWERPKTLILPKNLHEKLRDVQVG
uniref:S-AdoMet_synt_C domain-containing protein n=1 Tax=Globodera pallida TaxID=36090 RepID=A0A183BVR2_GLOPA